MTNSTDTNSITATQGVAGLRAEIEALASQNGGE